MLTDASKMHDFENHVGWLLKASGAEGTVEKDMFEFSRQTYPEFFEELGKDIVAAMTEIGSGSTNASPRAAA